MNIHKKIIISIMEKKICSCIIVIFYKHLFELSLFLIKKTMLLIIKTC